LNDAVDDTLVEGEVINPERFVQVRDRQRQSIRQPVPDVHVQLLQFVVQASSTEARLAAPGLLLLPNSRCNNNNTQMN